MKKKAAEKFGKDESDSNTNYNLCTWNNPKEPWKETEKKIKDLRKNWVCQDYNTTEIS